MQKLKWGRMVPFSSQREQYWGVGGVGGLFGSPAENFGMTSTTFCFTLLLVRQKFEQHTFEGSLCTSPWMNKNEHTYKCTHAFAHKLRTKLHSWPFCVHFDTVHCILRNMKKACERRIRET